MAVNPRLNLLKWMPVDWWTALQPCRVTGDLAAGWEELKNPCESSFSRQIPAAPRLDCVRSAIVLQPRFPGCFRFGPPRSSSGCDSRARSRAHLTARLAVRRRSLRLARAAFRAANFRPARPGRSRDSCATCCGDLPASTFRRQRLRIERHRVAQKRTELRGECLNAFFDLSRFPQLCRRYVHNVHRSAK